MASILDEYEDSQNTRQSAQQHGRLSSANIGLTHSGRSLSYLELRQGCYNLIIISFFFKAMLKHTVKYRSHCVHSLISPIFLCAS